MAVDDSTGIAESFLGYLSTELSLSQNTIENYGHDLRQFSALLPNGLLQPTASELRAVFSDLQAGGAHPSSLARKISTLRHFYRYARRKRLIARTPLRNIPLPKRPQRLPKPVSSSEFDKLLNAINSAIPGGLCELALVRLLDSCGLRVSELVKLEAEDLHLDESYIIVRSGKGDKDRFTPIDAPAAQALRGYLQLGRPKLYPGESRLFPLSRQRIWQIIRALCMRAGIPPRHPHQFRHRYGSEMAKTGLDPQEVCDLMGHAFVDTTMQYVGFDLSYIREIFRKTHPLAVNNEKRNRNLLGSPKTRERQ